MTAQERIQNEGNLKAGNYSPGAAGAIRKALDGKVLSPSELKAIENDRDFNGKVGSVTSKAAMSALLDDQAEKRATLASKPGSGGGGAGGKVPALIVGLAGLAGGTGGGGGGGGGSSDPGVSAPVYVDPPAVGPSVAPPVSGGTIQPLYTEPPVADDPPPETARLSGPETGMKIVEVLEGSAAQTADLRAGDIIYEVGGQRVRNWDEYKAAMAAVTGSVEMVFFNSESKQLEKLEVTPQNGLLGAALEEGVLPG